MSRAAAKFTQAEITRAVKGARQAGLNVTGVEIDGDGRIVIVTGEQRAAPKPKDNRSLVLARLRGEEKIWGT